MASPLFPALAAGALLALLAQIPPSLNAAQRWWPVMLRTASQEPEPAGTGGSGGLGSLSHRAPRHAAPRVLQQRSAHGDARGALAAGDATASAPARHTLWRQNAGPRNAGPRRQWGLPASALSGAAQASGLPPQTHRVQTRRSPANGSPAAHR